MIYCGKEDRRKYQQVGRCIREDLVDTSGRILST